VTQHIGGKVNDTICETFDDAVGLARLGVSITDLAHQLCERLTEAERLGLLDGDQPFWSGLASMMNEGYNIRPIVHGAVERLGIPGIRFVDGPRGCVSGAGTAFPVPMARGATWDVALEERVGEVIGREVRAQGGNFFGGVCINLPRHPAWGRIQETYGDEPYHLGEFGAALTRGAQRHVMACVKHFALNSMENARLTIDVTVSEADLHDMYLPHFKRVIDENVAAVMSAYNSVNGEWAGQNAYLLTEVLRNQWGWPGITVSDFVWGFRDAAKSLQAGLDLEEPFAQQRALYLPADIAQGTLQIDLVERAATRLLAAQLRHSAGLSEAAPAADVMANAEARSLAREVAGRAMVLLRNETVEGAPVLPLQVDKIRSIAVIGRLADAPNMGDAGSSDVRAPSHVTPLAGLRAAFPGAEIVYIGADRHQHAAELAAKTDVAIIIAGYDRHSEGEYLDPAAFQSPALTALYPPMPEGFDPAQLTGPAPMTGGLGGDRQTLTLLPEDEALILTVAAANPRTIVALVSGGAVLHETWRTRVPATLMMWYAGMEGGHALADVLSGVRNPSGRLPYAIPKSADHLPFYDREATAITYGRLHGQRLLDDLCVEAAYPHGFGLSYTKWAIESVETVRSDKFGAVLRVTVANQGGYDGHHVVQVYGTTISGPYRGQSMLVGFAAVQLPAGSTSHVDVTVEFSPLAHWDPNLCARILPEQGTVTMRVASQANDPLAVLL
jgi:beta-glucosidase